MIAVFLADGFEEIEALTTVDILRRAGLSAVTVSVHDRLTVTGSHGIAVQADKTAVQYPALDAEAIVLPGGMPGTTNLDDSPAVHAAIDSAIKRGAWVCAICAAPSILGRKGLLAGRKATAYPSFEQELRGAQISANGVVCDGRFITARGPGESVNFGLEIVRHMVSPQMADKLADSMQYPR